MTAERSHPESKARGGARGQGQQQEGATPRPRPGQRPGAGSQEGQPHIQGVGVEAVRAQQGLEEPPTLKVRKGGERRYPSSIVRSSGCALLEQP